MVDWNLVDWNPVGGLRPSRTRQGFVRPAAF
jgi:hypothetical protein